MNISVMIDSLTIGVLKCFQLFSLVSCGDYFVLEHLEEHLRLSHLLDGNAQFI